VLLVRPELQGYRATVFCPKCGAVGVVAWEKEGDKRAVVSLSNGFYQRVSNKDRSQMELVCTDCGGALPGA
jgi:hypothetical protein